jgi:hypothetical protein
MRSTYSFGCEDATRAVPTNVPDYARNVQVAAQNGASPQLAAIAATRPNHSPKSTHAPLILAGPVASIDTDGDGTISPEELAAWLDDGYPPVDAAPFAAQVDKDGPADEMPYHLRAMLDDSGDDDNVYSLADDLIRDHLSY